MERKDADHSFGAFGTGRKFGRAGPAEECEQLLKPFDFLFLFLFFTSKEGTVSVRLVPVSLSTHNLTDFDMCSWYVRGLGPVPL